MAFMLTHKLLVLNILAHDKQCTPSLPSLHHSSFYFVHTFRHTTTSNASDILNRTYQAQAALMVAHNNKHKITVKDYAVPISTIKL